jgi:UDPglucose 6-dehydrogenase
MNLKETAIGVVGNGVLGQAVVRGLVEHVDEVRAHDIMPERSTHSLDDVFECDIVFICLPTPSADNGDCDTTAIDELLAWIIERRQGRNQPMLVLRSTVQVGYTRKAAMGLKAGGIKPAIVHNPEFLTARCAVIDYHTPSRHVIGGVMEFGESRIVCAELMDFYNARFPGVPVFNAFTSEETEAIKLGCNAFFFTKVVFFNAMKRLCENIGMNWEHVRAGMLTDGRIGHSHTIVPGPDGQYGVGGQCLPKDTLNLASTLDMLELTHEGDMLAAVLECNDKLRQLDFTPPA